MADRYWVGGTGTWDASTTTNWSTTSGGAGGASAPTSADNAYFDDESDTGAAFTVTIGTGAVCADVIIGDGVTVDALDQTMTLAGTAALAVHGSWFNPATNFTRTYTGVITFSATSGSHTITTNGISFAAANVNTACITIGPAGTSTATWTLGGSLTVSTGRLFHNSGTFDTANYNLSASRIQFDFSNLTKVFNAGSATITTTNNFTNFAGSAITFNMGTSTVVLSGASGALEVTGVTFYNVEFTSTAVVTHTITGANTFNNLTFATRAASGIGTFTLTADQTITGTLTVQSGNTDPTKRYVLQSNTLGTARTITAAAIDFGSGVDFRDITAAGVASPFDVSALQGGNCGGNTNITFPAAKTVYRIGTGNFSATEWAATSGGSPAADQFPLAQDTMVFDANTTTGTHTINAGYQLGTLTMTNSTTVTLASGTTTPIFYGNVTLSNAVTPSGTGTFSFSGRSTQTITSSGRTFTQPITIQSLSTVQLADALVSNLELTLTQGTLDINNLTATVNRFVFSNSNTRSIAFGTGKIVLTGAGTAGGLVVWSGEILTNFTYTGIPTVELNNAGGLLRIIRNGSTGGSESNAISFNIVSGTGDISNSSGSVYKNFNLTGFSGTIAGTSNIWNIYGDLILSSTTSIAASNTSFNFFSTSGTQQIITNGVVFDRPITKGNTAATLQLQDSLTMGSTRTFTHTAGTVDLNGNTLTAGAYSTSNSNTRDIAFGNNGVVNIVGSGATAFNAATATNLTTSGTGAIKMSSASAKTFAGGGATYPVLEQAGAGTLTITGANTFANITNSNPTASQITFPASTTTRVQDFTLQGNPSELVSLRSSTSGTRFTIEKV
jgi:hypothetical protein